MKYAPPIGQEAQGEEAHYVDGNPELGILGSPYPRLPLSRASGSFCMSSNRQASRPAAKT